MYLLDTNVISELRKRDRCDEHVADWYTGTSDDDLFLSVLTLGEIRKGIALIQDRDPRQAQALSDWLEATELSYEGRILPIDADTAKAWGKTHHVRTVSVIDGLLVATAWVHDLTLVTRNVSDVEGLGASVFNPFSGPGRGD